MFAKDLFNKKYHLCSYEIQLVPNGILMVFNSKANNFVRLKKKTACSKFCPHFFLHLRFTDVLGLKKKDFFPWVFMLFCPLFFCELTVCLYLGFLNRCNSDCFM